MIQKKYVSLHHRSETSVLHWHPNPDPGEGCFFHKISRNATNILQKSRKTS